MIYPDGPFGPFQLYGSKISVSSEVEMYAFGQTDFTGPASSKDSGMHVLNEHPLS